MNDHAMGVLMALRRLNSELTVNNRVVAGLTGLKEGDLAVLDVLNREGPRSPTSLARRTRTHPATMTGVLTRLERDGWLERRPDATDRRAISIQPTAVERLTAVYTEANAALAQLCAEWPDDTIDVLVDFLTKATDTIHDAEARRSPTEHH